MTGAPEIPPGGAFGREVRVFLVDDHEVVRRGLRDLIEAEEGLTVVGEAGSAGEALARLPACRPDVAVLDVRLPDGDGVDLCRELKSRNEGLAALMLTSFDDDGAILSALMAGAAGYVLKQIRGTDLISAIRRVAAGETLLNPDLAQSTLSGLQTGSLLAGHETSFNILTPQERRILDLIAEGLTNRQIAQEMFLSEKTVKNYVSNLLRKLGLRGRTEAAIYATRRAVRNSVSGASTDGGSANRGTAPAPLGRRFPEPLT